MRPGALALAPFENSKPTDPTLVTADDLRETLKSFNPRPGWKARNIDASNGRLYDLQDYRDKRGMVEWDWDTGTVTAFWDGREIFTNQDSVPCRESAFRAVEDAAAAMLTEHRRNDPYYAEPGRWKRGD